MKSSLWEEAHDDYYKGEFDEDTLARVQEALKVVLPASYVELMKRRNGFRCARKYFPCPEPTSWANNSVQVDFLYGIGEDPGILDSLYLRKEWGIRSGRIVLLSADPPMFVGLDYRSAGKREPSVVFIDVERKQDIRLAATFAAFVEGLESNIEEDEQQADGVVTDEQERTLRAKIDQAMEDGKPGEIDKLFTTILSTNRQLIRYMVERMRGHANPKVHLYLMLFLMCCAEGDNPGMIEDEALEDMLIGLADSRNKDVRALVEYSLEKLRKRLGNGNSPA
ncbi:SMI1/KNR4 family protein [Paenibacillus xanthanilyticus]|uniref:SMI1/KNR4 family protein n=1 Tax=Paenibacillus xanthanilyticus TaxID=1783531 RepID=A0ABV8K3I0_9BACL